MNSWLSKKWFNIKRFFIFWKQRRTRGFDDSCTWSLDYDLAKHIAPRLKRFKQVNIAHPHELSEKEWDEILDKMITAFEFLASEDRWDCHDQQKWKDVQEGTILFGKYYIQLWW